MERRSFLRLLATLAASRAFESTASVTIDRASDVGRAASSKFAHLHMHTQYSLFDGVNKIPALVARVKELGMPAVAMTDHGNMFGAVEFYKRSVAAGVKPILGCEVYVARNDAGGDYHLTLLAMNQQGYQNLCRLVTKGIEKHLLRELAEGIIALSGCASSEVACSIGEHDLERARKVMEEYAGIFGDRYYVELQHSEVSAHDPANRELARLARELGLPLVATNDCHYLHADDAKAHEIMRGMQATKTPENSKTSKRTTRELYVKSPEEMTEAFAEFPEAVANTIAIAERCNVELRFGRYLFPVYETPHGESLEDHLERLAREGLERRLESKREGQYRERLDFELTTIRETGFAWYFLIVADFVGEAKRRGIPVGPGRSSAAGSLVAYALGITDIDPLPYGLLFERFLNPQRKSMPDFDVDFCFERRDEVIAYVKQKYGQDRVAEIVAFGTLKGKQAIREVGRVLGFDRVEIDRIAKLYPAPEQGGAFSLEKALEMEPRLREVRDTGPREKELFENAVKLEGLFCQTTRHNSGIVISNRSLVEDVPLFVDPEGHPVTQYAYHEIDAIGLTRFDFLGLKTLTLIETTLRSLRDRKGLEVDLADLALDDKDIYELLGRGETAGVFQMESPGMRKLLTELRPRSFKDLMIALALYRPGPLDAGIADELIARKHGTEPISYLHPILEPILEETYGVIVYQEQVMGIARAIAGYTLGDADNLRRTMGKRNTEDLARERMDFIDRASAQGIDAKLAAEIFDDTALFARYGFSKAHAAAYALISYRTAYLKTHHWLEFWSVFTPRTERPRLPLPVPQVR
jgi:DNA polymerase III subunit alpha